MRTFRCAAVGRSQNDFECVGGGQLNLSSQRVVDSKSGRLSVGNLSCMEETEMAHLSLKPPPTPAPLPEMLTVASSNPHDEAEASPAPSDSADTIALVNFILAIALLCLDNKSSCPAMRYSTTTLESDDTWHATARLYFPIRTR